MSGGAFLTPTPGLNDTPAGLAPAPGRDGLDGVDLAEIRQNPADFTLYFELSDGRTRAFPMRPGPPGRDAEPARCVGGAVTVLPSTALPDFALRLVQPGVYAIDLRLPAVSAQMLAGLTTTELLDLIGHTRGALLYRGADGWAALPPGEIGQVLAAAGAGADPVWVTGGAPAWKQIAQVAVSDPVASLDFTAIPQTYRDLLVRADGLRASADGVFLRFRVSADGATFSPQSYDHSEGGAISTNTLFSALGTISDYRANLAAFDVLGLGSTPGSPAIVATKRTSALLACDGGLHALRVTNSGAVGSDPVRFVAGKVTLFAR